MITGKLGEVSTLTVQRGNLYCRPVKRMIALTAFDACEAGAGAAAPKLKPVEVVGAWGAAVDDVAGAGVLPKPKAVEAVGAVVVDAAGAGDVPKLKLVDVVGAAGAVEVDVDVAGAGAAAPKLKPDEAAPAFDVAGAAAPALTPAEAERCGG